MSEKRKWEGHRDNSGSVFAPKWEGSGKLVGTGKFKLSPGVARVVELREGYVSVLCGNEQTVEFMRNKPEGFRLSILFDHKPYEGRESESMATCRSLMGKQTLSKDEEVRLEKAKRSVGDDWIRENFGHEEHTLVEVA